MIRDFYYAITNGFAAGAELGLAFAAFLLGFGCALAGLFALWVILVKICDKLGIITKPDSLPNE